MNNQEIIHNVKVPCSSNDKTLFHVNIQYVTQGDQVVRINSSKMENQSQHSRVNQDELVDGLFHTMTLMAVQSQHAYEQWKRLDKENKKLMASYQQLESCYKELLEKFSFGTNSQEQFHNEFNDSRSNHI